MTLTHMPVLDTSHSSKPYVVWRWEPEGHEYMTTSRCDPQTLIVRETSSLDIPEEAIIGLTPEGKFLVGEAVKVSASV